MFNIGGSEMIVLGILALLVFGPEGLPGIIKNVMRTVNAVKAAARDFQTEVSTALNDENERKDLAKRQRKPFVEPKEEKSLPPSPEVLQIGVAAVQVEPDTEEPVEREESEQEDRSVSDEFEEMAQEKVRDIVTDDDDGPGIPMTPVPPRAPEEEPTQPPVEDSESIPEAGDVKEATEVS